MRIVCFHLLSLMTITFNVSAAPEKPRHYVVPDEHLQLLPRSEKIRPVKKLNGLNLVKLTEEQILTLSSKIHSEKFSCGGFMDVEDQFANQSATTVLEKNGAKSISQLTLNTRQTLDIPSQITFPTPTRQVLSKITQSRYQQTLENLVAFTNRNALNDSGQRTSQWLLNQALSIFNRSSRNDYNTIKVQTGQIGSQSALQDSIVIRLKGSNSSLGAVVVGAHMDTILIVGGRRVTTGVQPGVDDDASGTAGVLEAMESIVSSGLNFKRDIYFAFYAAEEFGLLGSKKVVSHFQNENIQVRAVIQLDMIGHRSDRDIQKMFWMRDSTNPVLTQFGQLVARTFLGMTPENFGAVQCGYACSDHASWHVAGYPTMYPFESSMRNVNRNIHSANDTIDKINYEHAMTFVKLTSATIAELAEPL